VGLVDIAAGLPEGEDWTDDGGRFLVATCGDVRVASVYVPNGRVVGSEFYEAKLAWLDHLDGWLRAANQPTAPLALCGDFNVAPSDNDVWDAEAAHGGTHVSPPERDRIARLTAWGLTDVLGRFHPEPGYFTWWDYRAGHFHKNFGMRIDHVLATAPLVARAVAAERDRDARKPSTYPGIPSDHAPVVVDFA
jgi:exodeoxyribonuclease-3